MSNIEMHKVQNSSQVLEFGYDNEVGSLVVIFKSGGHDYKNVPREVYDRLIEHASRGGSVGGFFGTHIRGVYAFVKHKKADGGVIDDPMNNA